MWFEPLLLDVYILFRSLGAIEQHVTAATACDHFILSLWWVPLTRSSCHRLLSLTLEPGMQAANNGTPHQNTTTLHAASMLLYKQESEEDARQA